MGKYKVEISGINTYSLVVLSSNEMKNLFLKLKGGDLFARDLLIEGNLRLVLSILKRFYNIQFRKNKLDKFTRCIKCT